MSDELPIQMFDLRQRSGKKNPVHRTFKIAGPRQLTSVRLGPELLAKIDVVARGAWRSRNAEIQLRLEASLENQSIDAHGVIVVHSPTPLK